MPTWRKYVVGKDISGNHKKINKDFFSTEYAVKWGEFLRSKELKIILDKYECKLIFWPHNNIQPYLDGFNLPSYIVKEGPDDVTSIQEVFKKTDLLVTDYSSVAPEMAFMRKAVIYYQFDREHFFSGSHTYVRGYFDYEKDGFGPIALSLEQLLIEIEEIARNDFKVGLIYLDRMNNAFKLNDGKCCERCYKAIENLFGNDDIQINRKVLIDYIYSAVNYNHISLALKRIEIFYKNFKDEKIYRLKYLCQFVDDISKGIYNLEQVTYIRGMRLDIEENNIVCSSIVQCYCSHALFSEAYQYIFSLANNDKFGILLCRCSLDEKLLNSNNEKYNLFAKQLKGNFKYQELLDSVIDLNYERMLTVSLEIIKEYGYDNDLMYIAGLASAFSSNWAINSALRKEIENKFGRNVLWRVLSAVRAALDNRKNANTDCSLNIEYAFGSPDNIPVNLLRLYANSISGNYSKLEQFYHSLDSQIKKTIVLPIVAKAAFSTKHFSEYVCICENNKLDAGQISLARAYYKIGFFNKARNIYEKSTDLDCEDVLNLVNIYIFNNENNKARSQIIKYIESNPESLDVMSNKLAILNCN